MVVSQEHNDKYDAMAKKHGVTVSERHLDLFGVKSLDHLRELYEEDEHLNNIPLRVFDSLWTSLVVCQKPGRASISAAESCCMYKRLLVQLLEKEDGISSETG
jgi:hypothetical protein